MPNNSRNTVRENGGKRTLGMQCLGGLFCGLGRTRKNKAFTLIELLVVIAIMAILTTMLLPFGASLIDNTKREKTIQVLDSLRFALIGAENNYDANGNRIIGGYVGQFDALPDLITHYWDNTNKEWVIQYFKDGSDYLPYVYDEDLTDGYTYVTDGTAQDELYDVTSNNWDKFNQNAMPLALWTNYVKVGDGYQEIVDKDDWQGPYLARETDDVTGDDDIYWYDDSVGASDSPASKMSDANAMDEMRKFWLRQGGGRLLDGWGSALLFYMQDDDLYVVSAGSDRKIDYGTYYLDPDNNEYDNGPADTSLADNEDNLVMFLSKKQWDLTSQKIRMTQIKLKDLKTAILGKRGNMTGGVQQPNGFIADIGNLETLVGSYVYESTTTSPLKIYKCVKNHMTPDPVSTSALSGDNWEVYATVDTADDETLATHYPFAFKYSKNTNYYEANPSLLVMNASYVKVKDGTTADPEYTYYRYIDDEESTTTTSDPSSTSSDWVEDDTFAEHDWVLEHDDTGSTTYTNEIITNWRYFSHLEYGAGLEFGAGWNGPYMKNTTDPLTDAWGRQIVFEMDKNNSLLIRSRGPQVYKDGSTSDYYEDDDIIETIVHTDYAVPVTVIVKPEEDPSNAGEYLVQTYWDDYMVNDRDYVSIFCPYNGGMRYIVVGIDKDAGIGDSYEGVFKFDTIDQDTAPYDYTWSLEVTASENLEFDILAPLSLSSWHAGWIPTTKIMVVYHSYYYKDSTDTNFSYSPYPDATLLRNSDHTSGSLTTKYSYQKSFLIQPRTNPTLILGD